MNKVDNEGSSDDYVDNDDDNDDVDDNDAQ